MKLLAAQRGDPLRASARPSAEKKVSLKNEIDIRRHRALAERWELERSHGKKLKLARVGRRAGKSDGHMALHCLKGRSALNTHWMLCFAQEMDLAPQEIWGEDWPFSDQTLVDLLRVIERWRSLPQKTRQQIIGLAQKSD